MTDKANVQTRIFFGFGDGGMEFRFFDYPVGEEFPEDMEPTYVIGFTYDEIWGFISVVFRELQKSPGKRSLWGRIRAMMK